VNTSRDSVKCLKDPSKKLCGWNLKSELSSRICCDLDDLSEECGQISGVTCSNDLEKLGDKAGYLLALPSEDCENTKFIAKDHSPLFLNISYVHPELVCVVKIRNKGSYSSRLRLIEDEFTNVDAFIYETDLDHTFFEKRGQFTSSEAISPVGDLRDFHIWYDNTSVIVVLAKDATQGHGVFKADLHSLPAFEDEIEHIEDHMKQVKRDWLVFAMFIIGVILVI